MTQTCRLIAITGGSASGKSRLSQALAQHFAHEGSYVLAEDDYYVDAGNMPGFNPSAFNFDEPAAKDHALLGEHLGHLRQGRPIAQPVYDFATHCRAGHTVERHPAPVVIVEGMHLLCAPALREHFHFSVYVSAGDPLRLQRRIARDVAERSRTEAFARQQFETHVRPMHDLHVEPQKPHADLILENRGAPDFEALVRPVVEHIRRLQPAV